MDDNFLRFDKTKKYLWCDVETENLCLHQSFNVPWQIGMILVEGLTIKESHNIYIKWPNIRMSKDAARITGYDQKVIDKKGIAPEEALDIFEKQYNNSDVFAGHNILGFDIFVVEGWRKLLGKPATPIASEKEIIDTLCLAKAIHKDIKKPDNITPLIFQIKMLNERVKGSKLKLSDLAKKYDIEMDEAKLHDADYDLQLNIQIWDKMKYEINF
jgi:DNA polymerase III epsilon subunit-like protein